ncbi:MerR family transcriptional regulator [Anaerocolumna sp.]|uniref:MerR family transcriptional regulator n=1 Tax=Anaerocolumna sp. TaxID=2041569 RepID=UPI0028A71440|nr:MerR family transcriptional regulator [Anaerocolumna sp.]
MKTVKQVSQLTGISIRTLQYYDEIGLFKPSQVTDAGYRLYNDDSLEVLQQILFFKELDFQLKDIKEIIENPNYDKIQAYRQQKELIQAKRDRLNGLLELLERLEKGEKCMSFKEFDMSEYFNALQKFRETHTDEIIKQWGSVKEFDKMTELFENKESEIAKIAIKQYGSIEKYTEAMKKNLDNFSETIEKINSLKNSDIDYVAKNTELNKKLTSDLTRDVSSKEVQDIVKDIVDLFNETTFGLDMGDNYWDMVAEGYLTNEAIIEANDKIYGEGAAKFVGSAIKSYINLCPL